MKHFAKWPLAGFFLIGCYAVFMALVLTHAAPDPLPNGSASASAVAFWSCGWVGPILAVGLLLIVLYIVFSVFPFTTLFSVGSVLITSWLIQPFPEHISPIVFLAAGIGLMLDTKRWGST